MQSLKFVKVPSSPSSVAGLLLWWHWIFTKQPHSCSDLRSFEKLQVWHDQYGLLCNSALLWKTCGSTPFDSVRIDVRLGLHGLQMWWRAATADYFEEWNAVQQHRKWLQLDNGMEDWTTRHGKQLLNRFWLYNSIILIHIVCRSYFWWQDGHKPDVQHGARLWVLRNRNMQWQDRIDKSLMLEISTEVIGPAVFQKKMKARLFEFCCIYTSCILVTCCNLL